MDNPGKLYNNDLNLHDVPIEPTNTLTYRKRMNHNKDIIANNNHNINLKRIRDSFVKDSHYPNRPRIRRRKSLANQKQPQQHHNRQNDANGDNTVYDYDKLRIPNYLDDYEIDSSLIGNANLEKGLIFISYWIYIFLLIKSWS